jgi:hypothetical protein
MPAGRLLIAGYRGQPLAEYHAYSVRCEGAEIETTLGIREAAVRLEYSMCAGHAPIGRESSGRAPNLPA